MTPTRADKSFPKHPEVSEINITPDISQVPSPNHRNSQNSSPGNKEAMEKLGLNFQKVIINNLIEQSTKNVIFEKNDYLPFISSQASFIEKLLNDTRSSNVAEEAPAKEKDSSLVFIPVQPVTHRRDFSEFEIGELFNEMLPTHLREEFQPEFEIIGDILTMKGFEIFEHKVEQLLCTSELLLGVESEIENELFVRGGNLEE